MSSDDIFSSRLKLLIVMAKAYLKDVPYGTYRKSAIIENAHYVFYRSLILVSELESHLDIASEFALEWEREFHLRVRLLAVMAKAIAEDRLTGNSRKKALQDNLDEICDALIFKFNLKDVKFLKVA